MKRVLLAAIAIFVLASSAWAQTPVPSPTPPATRLAWDHDGVNVAGFSLTIDGTRQDLGAVTRLADGHYEVAFPALTPGDHTLQVRAYNIAGDGAAAVLTVRVMVLPSPVTGLRIVAP